MDISALVFVHITAGSFAIAAGGIAMLTRKGAALHRMAGSAFFVAMLGMCLAALPVAIVRQQSVNIAAATFTLYLIATAWMAAVRKDGETGAFETGAFLAGATIAAVNIFYGAAGPKDAAPFLYVIGGLAAFAALLDLSVIARGGVAGAQRIARHLWRMGFAMFVATGSFFLGQAKFIPLAIRDANLHFVPPIAVITLLLFWLFRVLLTNWYKNAGASNLNDDSIDVAHLSQATASVVRVGNDQ